MNDNLAAAIARLARVRAANEISNEEFQRVHDEVYGTGDAYGAMLADEAEVLDAVIANANLFLAAKAKSGITP